jgi:hypothetical protein
VENIHVREQCVVLEHHAKFALVRGKRVTGPGNDLAGQPDFATQYGLKTGNRPQGSGFAAAARAEQADHIAFLNLHRQAVHRGVVFVTAYDVVDFEDNAHGAGACRSITTSIKKIVLGVCPDYLHNRNSSSAFCACRRFSASSQTTLCGPSMTSAETSSPR